MSISHGNVITEHGQADILDGAGANALFTQTSKNAGGVDYASSVAGSNQTSATLAGDTADGATGTLAWEDLAATKNKNGTYSKPGDADYNDAVFNVSIYHAPPVAKNDANTISEDAGATTLNVLVNDSDPNAGATFGVTSVHTSGLLGTVTIAANGQSITYNPGSAFQYLAVGEKATETFTYTIIDSFGGTSTATETVTITGVNDAPTIASANAAATITEIADNASGENTATRNASGSISFNDADISDNHTVSSTAIGTGYLGTFTATLSADTNNNGDNDPGNPSPGSVTWNFSLKDSALDYLSAGQTLTQKYNVVISDGHGGTTTQVVTITLVGTNDAPTISSAVTTGGVTELPDNSPGENTATLTSSGTISFNDVDLADVHTTSVTAGGSGYVGTLTAAVSNDSAGDGAGTVTWTFSVPDGAIDFLSAGQKLTQTYTVAINDGHGGTASKNITITITGAADSTNHAPVAVADIASVTEDVTLTASGNVLTNDTDADASDTHSVTAVNGSGANVGTVVIGTYGTLALSANGTYTYTLANGQTNVQALTQGQIVSDVFTDTNSDNHGGSSSSSLTISITGTNDVAVIGGSHAGSVTEDVSLSGSNLTASGTLAVSDADAGQSSFTAQGGTAGSNGYGTFTLATSGNWTYSANNGQSAIQHLGAGQTITDGFTAVSSDGSSSQVVTVTISGTNDAPVANVDTNAGDAVMESGVVVGGNTSFAGDSTASGNVIANDTDVDAGDSHSVTAVNGVASNVGIAIGGTFGTLTLNANGSYTYGLNNGLAATNALAQGDVQNDVFTYTNSDNHGGSSTTTLSIAVIGTNDKPAISSGATTGGLKEDTINSASGQFTVVDPDHNAQQFWTVVGGTPSSTANYHFSSDSFTVTKANGTIIALQDNFDGTLPVPHSASDTTYVGIGGFTEVNGKLLFDSSNAASFVGVGTNDPIIGQDAIVKSNVDANTSGQGLKIGTQFTVSSVFDLIVPDSPREAYGVRLTDRLTNPVTNADNTVTSAQQGDDTFELVVRETPGGQSVVSLRQLNFDADVTTNLQNLALNAPVGADQIILTFNHNPNDSFATASFQYVNHNNPTVILGSQSFTAIAQIFGTAPGSVDSENWTRAEIVAYAPQYTDSILGGSYGTLDVSQSGSWTYTLNNALASTQSLSEGQQVTDTFQVQVADQFGATDTRTVTVNVTGTNDAPVILLPNGIPPAPVFVEDSAPMLTTTAIVNFSDVDLADTHTISTSLASAMYSGGSLSSGLMTLLQNALVTSTTPFDDATGDGHGQYQLNFSLDDSAVQFLGAGQTLTATYHTTVADSSPFAPASHLSAGQDVTVTISGVNDAPAAAAISAEDNADSPATLTASFTDADTSDTHTFSVDTAGTVGIVINNGDGTFSYDPNGQFDYLAAGDTATDTFQYAVDDGHGGISTATATVTIDGVGSSAPTVTTPTISGAVQEGQTLTASASSGGPNQLRLVLVSG